MIRKVRTMRGAAWSLTEVLPHGANLWFFRFGLGYQQTAHKTKLG
jgi:hypothetical protein